MSDYPRDLIGYGANPPHANWPDDLPRVQASGFHFSTWLTVLAERDPAVGTAER